MTEPTIWGIHAGKYGEADPLFERGTIALGWTEVGDLSSVPATRESFKAVLREALPDAKEGAIPVNAGQLFRFVHVAASGDLVIWRPKSDPSQIRIGELTGKYHYDPQDDSGYPHQRAVSWKITIGATRLSQGALFELGAAMSFFSIKNHVLEWLSFLDNGFGPRPVEDLEVEASETTDGPVANQIEESTRDFILKTLSRDFKGHPLASFVAHVLNAMGYRTRVSPPGADGGIDIIAHKDELGFEPPIIKVQVKSGDGRVGHPEVSSLLGTLSPGEHGLLVALGGFTPQAVNLTRTKSNLRLIDGDGLVELILAHYETFDSRYRGLLPLKRVYVPDLDLVETF